MDELWLQVASLEQLMSQKQNEWDREPGNARYAEMYVLYAHLWRTAKAAARAIEARDPTVTDAPIFLVDQATDRHGPSFAP